MDLFYQSKKRLVKVDDLMQNEMWPRSTNSGEFTDRLWALIRLVL